MVSLEPLFRRDYEVRPADGARLSRTRRAELARRLGRRLRSCRFVVSHP
jgi:hypothetical protein